jgi:hypothetical protein
VAGSGRHGIASRLHLHPDAPSDAVGVTALAGALRREPAPLHERFGETREMTRLVVEAEVALPWAGGFWIGLGAPARGAAAVALEGAVLRLRVAAPHPLAVDWRLDARDESAVALATS